MNENPVQHDILCCKQETCLQELSRIVRLAGMEWCGQKEKKVCSKHSISGAAKKVQIKSIMPGSYVCLLMVPLNKGQYMYYTQDQMTGVLQYAVC